MIAMPNEQLNMLFEQLKDVQQDLKTLVTTVNEIKTSVKIQEKVNNETLLRLEKGEKRFEKQELLNEEMKHFKTLVEQYQASEKEKRRFWRKVFIAIFGMLSVPVGAALWEKIAEIWSKLNSK